MDPRTLNPEPYALSPKPKTLKTEPANGLTLEVAFEARGDSLIAVKLLSSGFFGV